MAALRVVTCIISKATADNAPEAETNNTCANGEQRRKN
jgi:hypothetical protein